MVPSKTSLTGTGRLSLEEDTGCGVVVDDIFFKQSKGKKKKKKRQFSFLRRSSRFTQKTQYTVHVTFFSLGFTETGCFIEFSIKMM